MTTAERDDAAGAAGERRRDMGGVDANRDLACTPGKHRGFLLPSISLQALRTIAEAWRPIKDNWPRRGPRLQDRRLFDLGLQTMNPKGHHGPA